MIPRRAVASVASLVLAVGTMAFAMRPQDAASKPADAVKAASASIDPAKRREIERLLELSGTREAMRSQIDTMTKGFANMNMPPEMIKAMKEEFTNGLGEMVNMTIEVYDRNFSMEELKAFVAFYESPTGQTISKKMPTVLRESTEAGMKWGQQMQPKLMKRMAELRAAEAKKPADGAGADGSGG